MKSIVRKNNQLLLILLLSIATVVFAYIIAIGQLPAVGILIVLPLALGLLVLVFVKPETALFVIMIYSFIINGIGRYVTGPFSVLIDLMLLLALISMLFYVKKADYEKLKNGLVFLICIWTFYTILQIFNPEALGIKAWFFAVRSLSFYLLLLVCLTILLFKQKKDLDTFLTIWFVGGIVSALYGIKQIAIGLSAADQAWLDAGAAQEHILFGKLRVFSFYSDAGQFGAFMAFTSLVAFICSIKGANLYRRAFSFFTGLLCAYGMLISGTRGALFVFLGAMVYLLLDKNFKTFTMGLVVLGSLFCVLKFTYIGAGNYNIQRLRSAVSPTDDPSFLIRLANQRKIADYLSTRPFGGGVGTSGYWGQRFKPGSFLAETPTDSWYVRIWAETGRVGLVLYALVIFGILVYEFFIVLNLKDKILKQKLNAIYAGCFGIMVASYGNQLIGQFPTSVYFSMGLAIIYLGKMWDTEQVLQEKDGAVLSNGQMIMDNG